MPYYFKHQFYPIANIIYENGVKLHDAKTRNFKM